MAQYGKSTYWDERYTKDSEHFDWYQRYSGIKNFIVEYIKPTDNILVSGAGNSRLSEEMIEDGYQTITNIDISQVVIDQMAHRYKGKDQLIWKQMNVCSLDFPAASFDAVIDKGTLDAILCGEGSAANVAKMCQEISRVLKPAGVYFIVSYGVPDNRLSYLENDDYGWKVTIHTVPKPSVSAISVTDSNDPQAVHYIYICQKGDSASKNA